MHRVVHEGVRTLASTFVPTVVFNNSNPLGKTGDTP